MTPIVIHPKFLSSEKCDDILKIASTSFEIDSRTYSSNWHAKTNRSAKFQEEIFNLLAPISPFFPFHITWINLTEYQDNRALRMHTDTRSQNTFTIVLTQDYVGGDFIIQSDRFVLKKGDCISFNGADLIHGVDFVTEGYRAALNVWIKPGKPPIL